MLHPRVPLAKEAVLSAAALLLLGPQVLAGDRYHSPSRPATPSRSAPAVVAYAGAPAVSVVVAMPPQPAKKPLYVNLRGPDGWVRRFVVEGGRAAIQYRQVVIRPGQSVSIRWVAGK